MIVNNIWHFSKSLSFFPSLFSYIFLGGKKMFNIQNLTEMMWRVCCLYLLGHAFLLPLQILSHVLIIQYFRFIPFVHINLLLPEEFFFNSTPISSNLEHVWHLPCPSIFLWLLVFLPFLSPYLLSTSFFLLISWDPVQTRSVSWCLSPIIFDSSTYKSIYQEQPLHLPKGSELHSTESTEIPVRRLGSNHEATVNSLRNPWANQFISFGLGFLI